MPVPVPKVHTSSCGIAFMYPTIVASPKDLAIWYKTQASEASGIPKLSLGKKTDRARMKYEQRNAIVMRPIRFW